jgi:hypothetical protein
VARPYNVPAEERLTLLSAGTSERRQAMRAQAEDLCGEIDWARFTETLCERKLLPVLGPRVLELVGGEADPRFADAVARALELGRRRGAFMQLICVRVMSALAEAGIRSAALKGPLLAEAIYHDPGRRISSDLDLLVASEQLQAAVEVVRTLDYESSMSDYVQADGLPLLHFVLAHRRGELPPVELHWRVHWYEQEFARERLLPEELDPRGEWRPQPVDELAALLLFYARDGFIDLRLASDLSAWWDVYGAQLPAGALDGVVRAYPALARVLAVAVEVAEEMAGLPAHAIFAERRELSRRQRIAVRLANPNPNGSRAQLYADMGLIDGLLAPTGGFGEFVRRQLLPPSEVLEAQARHGSRRHARSPLARCTGVLARYGLRMARLAGAPRSPTLGDAP